ncbi:MAG: hypothetical protein ACRDU5_17215 [Mycobacterium sp.]
MNTINRKKSVAAIIGGAIAAAAVPAALLANAGTAQAETQVVPFTDALGVSVHVVSVGPLPSSGWCSYTAKPAIVPPGVLPPLPVYNVPFYLQENAVHKLWFPGIQTGTTWDVDVNCASGGDTPVVQRVY